MTPPRSVTFPNRKKPPAPEPNPQAPPGDPLPPIPRIKHAGGRPAGQFAYNRSRLLEFLRFQEQPCEMTNEQLAQELLPFIATATDSVSARQVSRWLQDLVKRGDLKIVEMHYRVRYKNAALHWKNVRKIQVVNPEEQPKEEA